MRKETIVKIRVGASIALICLCAFFIAYNSEDPIAQQKQLKSGTYIDTHDYFTQINEETRTYYEGYFKDSNGNSYYQTISEGDISDFVKQFTPNGWINFVQMGIVYKPDYGNVEDQFYTVEETLQRGCGDCEDQAMLMARGLKDLGFNVKLLYVPNHVITVIDKEQVDSGLNGIYKGFKPSTWGEQIYTDKDGKEWYPIESTSVRNIGEYNKDLTPYIVYDV